MLFCFALIPGLSEDAEVGDVIGVFGVNYPAGVTYSVERLNAGYGSGVERAVSTNLVSLSTNSKTGRVTLSLNGTVDEYSYLTIALRAAGDRTNVTKVFTVGSP